MNARNGRSTVSCRVADCGSRAACECWLVFGVGILLFMPTSLAAQPAEIYATANVEPKRTALSGSVEVTVTIEGPAPLLVEPPKPLLTPDANVAWRIRPDNNGKATLTVKAKSREQWQQVYQLDPYQIGENLVITFVPFTVNGRIVRIPAMEVSVTKTVEGADASAARPVTPPEDVPEVITDRASPRHWAWVACVVALMIAAVLLAAQVRRRKARFVPPCEQAVAELVEVETRGLRGSECALRVSEVLRRFIELRFAIPATKLTTGELLATATQQGWAVEEADALRVILDECDRAKFTGDVPNDDWHRRLVRLAVDWLNHIGRPAGPG